MIFSKATTSRRCSNIADVSEWHINKLLGSGGFGDVYKVVKENDADKKEYAMKTEMCEGDKRMLRLKIEVRVLGLCLNVENPEKRKHFIDLIDRGKTEKFKFMVMSLVGPSLEDIRKNIVGRNFSKSTGMQAAYQTLQAIGDLHEIGYLHRDIKPQNFAVGLGEDEKTIYMLDFGIARKYTVGNTKQVKYVKISGNTSVCFASLQKRRPRNLDLHGSIKSSQVVVYKEKFFRFQCECYRLVPNQFKRIVEYVNGMTFEETSSDNKNTGSDDSEESDKISKGSRSKLRRRSGDRLSSDSRKRNSTVGRKKLEGVAVAGQQ
ncbi:unnamed protein product [Cylicostephanus goldi]|uniref:Protein kinase domain-containing protein n=1 Tax=Cylicostephanus goldi TaxID=71465 RepID=A0A3P6QNV0_CYLGO|nr:unnamed protein product [Cylicostephanus goldi]